jgi:hypothetical protein
VGVNEPGLLVVAAGTAGVEGVGAGVFVGGNAVGCIRGGGEGEGAVFDSLVMMMVRKNSQDLEKGRGGFFGQSEVGGRENLPIRVSTYHRTEICMHCRRVTGVFVRIIVA